MNEADRWRRLFERTARIDDRVSEMKERSIERAVDATLRLEMQMELAGLMYDVEHGEDRLGDPEE